MGRLQEERPRDAPGGGGPGGGGVLSGYGKVGFAIAEAKRLSDALLADHPELAEDEKAFRDTLDGATDALDVVRALARAVLRRRRLINGAASDASDLSRRRARFKAQEERLRAAIVAIMQAAQQTKLEEPGYTLWLTKARDGGRRLRCLDPDAAPPPDFAKQPPPVWDEDKVEAALEAGEDVPGWTLETPNTGPSVTIKTT